MPKRHQVLIFNHKSHQNQKTKNRAGRPPGGKMPYKLSRVKGGYRVRGPSGIHAKHTTLAKALRQMRLLRMIEHGGKPRRRRR